MSDAERLAGMLREARADRQAAFDNAITSHDLLAREYIAALRDEQNVRDQFAAIPANDRAALMETDVPVLMLPVRIETRFAGTSGQPSLKIRVYPDQIHADNHEPLLTHTEWQAGIEYWRHSAAGRNADEWLRTIVGAARAGYVKTATQLDSEQGDEAKPPKFRSPGWVRPAAAAMLPESWQVRLNFAGSSVAFDFPKGVPDRLPLAPSETDQKVLLAGGGLDALWNGNLGPGASGGIAWMLDFAVALENGMAIELSAAHAPDLFAHAANGGSIDVTVIGVRAAETASEGAASFEKHLAALGAGNPIAAIAQGARTQSDGRRSASENEATDGKNRVLSAALGITGSALSLVDAQGASEDTDATNMSHLAWRFGFGAFARDALGLPENQTWYEAADFASRNLRARGTLPLLRIGPQPYGVHIVSASKQNMRSASAGFHAIVARALGELEPLWSGAAGQAPRISFDQRQDAELLRNVLMHDANVAGLFGWLGAGIGSLSRNLPAGDLLDRLGIPGADQTRAARQVFFAGRALDIAGPAPFVRYDIVPARSFSPEWKPLDLFTRDTITFVTLRDTVGADRYPVQVWREYPRILNITPGAAAAAVGNPAVLADTQGDPPDPVFQTLMRQSLFDLFQRVATVLLEDAGEAVPADIGIDPSTGGRTFPRIEACIAGPMNGDEQRMRFPLDPDDARRLPDRLTREIEEVTRAAEHLATMVDEEEDRLALLLREQLSLLTYRLDPWHSALARIELEAVRETRPAGLHIGAWGRVERLRIGASGEIGKNYLHAPSLPQAATAAILRSGHQARCSETGDDKSYAIDLSSAKLSAAREVLSGLNGGRPLASILGFRIERELRGASGLNQGQISALTDRLREIAPAIAGKMVDDARTAGDADLAGQGPNDVFDGLELLRRFEADRGSLLSEVGPGASALAIALGKLEGEVDAIADLLLAEGVHQLTSGNPERAGASIDALSRGESPPDRFDSIDTPRPGTGVEIRLIGVAAAPAEVGQLSSTLGEAEFRSALPAALGPLARLVDRWIGGLEHFTVAVTVREGETMRWSQELSPHDLGLAPCHLVLPSEHVRRLIARLAKRHARRVSGADLSTAEIEIGWEGSELSVALLALDPLRSAVHGSRSLAPSDLAESEEADGVVVDQDELKTRSDRAAYLFGLAIAGLREAAGAAPTADELAALQAGAPADPLPLDGISPIDDAPTLLAAGSALDMIDAASLSTLYEMRGGLGEAQRHSLDDSLAMLALLGLESAAGDMTDPPAFLHAMMGELRRKWGEVLAAADPETRLRKVFGEALPFPPTLSVAPDAPIRHADAAAESEEVTEWLDKVAKVRRPSATLRDGLAWVEALTQETKLEFTAAQLPGAAGSPWAATQHPSKSGARIAFAIHGELGSDPLGGLMIDTWSEHVPDAEGTTGLATQVASPQARAPQALLLLLPPGEGERWTVEALLASVDRTFEFVAMRGVRPSDLSAASLPLPLLQLGGKGG